MSAAQQELSKIAHRLSDTKLEQLVHYAAYLESLSEEGDVAWEQLISYPKRRPKLDSFIKEAMAEGPSELLSAEKL
jgi:hypothetical protein